MLKTTSAAAMALVLCCLPQAARSEWDSFGHFRKGPAPAVQSRTGWVFDDGTDPMATYGLPCKSPALKGKLFQVGTCADQDGKTDACAVLYRADGTKEWTWIRNEPGEDGLTGAAEFNDGSYLLAFGYANHHRTVFKLDPMSGIMKFQYTWQDFENSAFEFGFFGKDGDLYLAGLKGAPDPKVYKWRFKAAGGVSGGQGLWQRMSQDEVSSDAPTNSSHKIHAEVQSLRSMKEAKDGFIAIGTTPAEEKSSLLKLQKDGTKRWEMSCSDCGVFTSVAVSQDGTEYATTGHCTYDPSSQDLRNCADPDRDGVAWTELDGTVSAWDNGGNKKWTKRFPTPTESIGLLNESEQRVVREECWSIESTADGGYVLGCSSDTDCESGGVPMEWKDVCKKADLAKSQSLVTKISHDGTLEWQEIHRLKSNSDWGAETGCVYVTQMADGTYAVTLEDENGMGWMSLLKDSPPSGPSPISSPGPSPTPSPGPIGSPTSSPGPSPTPSPGPIGSPTSSPGPSPTPSPGPIGCAKVRADVVAAVKEQGFTITKCPGR